jgi:hypothetical protein
MGATSHAGMSVRAAHVPKGLRRRENWVQLVKFGVVGTSGYVVNLAVYTLLLKAAGLHYVAAATGSLLAGWRRAGVRSNSLRLAEVGHGLGHGPTRRTSLRRDVCA